MANSKSEAKRIAIMKGEPCMCRVHLSQNPGSMLTCEAHGAGCPCYEQSEIVRTLYDANHPKAV